MNPPPPLGPPSCLRTAVLPFRISVSRTGDSDRMTAPSRSFRLCSVPNIKAAFTVIGASDPRPSGSGSVRVASRAAAAGPTLDRFLPIVCVLHNLTVVESKPRDSNKKVAQKRRQEGVTAAAAARRSAQEAAAGAARQQQRDRDKERRLRLSGGPKQTVASCHRRAPFSQTGAKLAALLSSSKSCDTTSRLNPDASSLIPNGCLPPFLFIPPSPCLPPPPFPSVIR